ncbi:WD40 repeat domain-containing protein [Dictyobacter kobayashii]|uniref:IFT140 first beta-propeller domain-containing protein n=1 Tax=Dictyobacter kobayashii TaxID=2014872 RepID=A0A402AV00_9CHLR|nr:WD40 repeat domain-containing protein [Dictyobacter kobayashii]GCE22951.1 hypothetical protein KDK_67510 [Dictyobacter kobayashii]
MTDSIDIHPGTTLVSYHEGYAFVNPARWSPDGTRIFSAGYSYESAQIWDPLTGQTLLQLPHNIGSSGAAAWSPDSLSLAVAIGGADQTIHIYDTETGQMRVKCGNGGHTNWTLTISWSPDGRFLATGYYCYAVVIWDAQTGRKSSLLEAHQTTINSIAWSPDGQYLATASDDGLVYVWNAHTATIVYTYKGHNPGVTVVAWSPDSLLLASGNGGAIHIWQALAGQLLTAYQHSSGQISELNWSPDGQYLAVGAWYAPQVVYDIQRTTILATYDKATAFTNNVSWSVDSSLLACTGEGVHLWEVHTDKTILRRGQPTTIYTSRPSPDGSLIATVNATNLYIWEASTGSTIAIYRPTSTYIQSIDWSPTGTSIVSGHMYGEVLTWNIVSRDARPLTRTYLGQQGTENSRYTIVASVAYAPGGKLLAAARCKTIFIWDVETGEEVLVYRGHENELEHTLGVRRLCWSPDGQYLASCSEDVIQVWDVRTGQHIQQFSGDSEQVMDLAWSPTDGRIAVAQGTDISIWEASSGKRLAIYSEHLQKTIAVSWSPDGQMLASVGSEQDTVHVWTAANGLISKGYVYRGHSPSSSVFAGVKDAHWLPDGKHIVSSAREVNIWRARY